MTGTDGKSTTSWILFHFLKDGFSSLPVYLGGNFGTPLADILGNIRAREEKVGHIVLEVSSFMAYRLEKFQPTNSLLTNLHPDHLDWHRDLHEYYHAKLNLLARTQNILVYFASARDVFPELRDYAIESIVLPDQITIEHNLVPLSPDVLLDISERQLF